MILDLQQDKSGVVGSSARTAVRQPMVELLSHETWMVVSSVFGQVFDPFAVPAYAPGHGVFR